MRRTRISGVVVLLIALFAGIGNANADGSDWLVGHWDGHDSQKAGDKRIFALDVAAINGDHSFVAQWTIDGVQSRGQGSVQDATINIAFPSGNSAALSRASDGTLTGKTTLKDGSPGVALIFVKAGSATGAVPSAASAKGCEYHPPAGGRGGANTAPLHADDGDVVAVLRMGTAKCVNGTLVPVQH